MNANSAHDSGRRRFLNWFLGTSVGALAVTIVYPVFRFISPPHLPEAATNQVDAGFTTDPGLVERGFKIVRFGLEPVIVIRLSETEYRAFAGTCTHLDCIVEYHKDKKLVWCNCHNGAYNLKGQQVAGPPPKPLAPYKVDLVARGPGQPEAIVVSRA